MFDNHFVSSFMRNFIAMIIFWQIVALMLLRTWNFAFSFLWVVMVLDVLELRYDMDLILTCLSISSRQILFVQQILHLREGSMRGSDVIER